MKKKTLVDSEQINAELTYIDVEGQANAGGDDLTFDFNHGRWQVNQIYTLVTDSQLNCPRTLFSLPITASGEGEGVAAELLLFFLVTCSVLQRYRARRDPLSTSAFRYPARTCQVLRRAGRI